MPQMNFKHSGDYNLNEAAGVNKLYEVRSLSQPKYRDAQSDISFDFTACLHLFFREF